MSDAPILLSTRLRIRGVRQHLHLLFCHDVTIYQQIVVGPEPGHVVADAHWLFRSHFDVLRASWKAMRTAPSGEAKS